MQALALRIELAPTRVNTLSPGITDTPLLGRAFGDELDAFVSGLKEKLPLHRLVTAAEAGAAVVFLMTNGRINGETLHIDGVRGWFERCAEASQTKLAPCALLSPLNNTVAPFTAPQGVFVLPTRASSVRRCMATTGKTVTSICW